MRYLLVIGLFFMASMRGLAQPGAFGGSLRFRLFDPQGRLISPNSVGYQCFSSWDSLASKAHSSAYRNNVRFAHTFTYERDGYWKCRSTPTPAGGFFPPNFTIVVVHGRDTMRIQGPWSIRYKLGTQVDSIPYSPGHYRIPSTYANLVNVRAVGGRISNSGWDFFRDSAARPDRITTARLVLPQETGAKPDSTASCSRLLVRHHAASEQAHSVEPSWSDVYLANGTQEPKLLLRHLAGTPKLVACAGSRLLVMIDARIILKSENEGATWRVYQLRDEVVTKWHGYLYQANELNIERLWCEGNQVFAYGSRNWTGTEYHNSSDLHELYFTQDTTSVVVRGSRTRLRNDFRAVLARWEQQQKQQFLESVRVEISGSQNQAFVRQRLLRRSWFGQADPYVVPLADLTASKLPAKSLMHPERPLLTLRDGRFQYDGTIWAKTPWEDVDETEVAAFKLNGTYTATDSTLTFRAPPGSKLPPDVAKAHHSFYPLGTYYYYYYLPTFSTKPIIYLKRWDEEGGYPTDMTFQIHY